MNSDNLTRHCGAVWHGHTEARIEMQKAFLAIKPAPKRAKPKHWLRRLLGV